MDKIGRSILANSMVEEDCILMISSSLGPAITDEAKKKKVLKYFLKDTIPLNLELFLDDTNPLHVL